ncbi:hypothetical protein Sdia_39230 [Streptomyces diastaticus subsp. diastaticus]|uniref:Uncharacterized protein n=1 Tax=Streptomyces diastaticus subsp. diastaticus TaxID=68040 RepID=A0ABQ1CS51_STRDI|nr:hypothetical protein Sdia_39230 [Streptomyces diastaticus subsp. diastaticus]GGU24676.1 hypothetical protein GCM10015534_29100 [Streptomyces diastaticus subsp. diastaticus]
MRINASVSSTGVETVIGPSSNSAAAATSTAAFSRKIRQNNDRAGWRPSFLSCVTSLAPFRFVPPLSPVAAPSGPRAPDVPPYRRCA